MIALTLWTPRGILGAIRAGIFLTQGVGGTVNAADLYYQGKNGEATKSLVMALGSFALMKSPSQWGNWVEKRAGWFTNAQRAEWLGNGAAQLAGAAAPWLARGMLGAGTVMGVQTAQQRFAEGDILGGVLSLGQAAAGVRAAMRSCFTAEMLLDVEGGKKRADAIVEGDRLWSRSEFDPEGPLALKEVEEVFVRVAPVLNVRVAGQVLRTTAEHPFWVENRGGWQPAGVLEVGDLVRTRCGLLVPVEAVGDSGEVTTV